MAARVEGSTASAAFRSNAHAPGAARRWLRARLLDWGCPALVDTAELCISEVVSNAVRHAEGDIAVEASMRHGRLHVEVCDADGEALPRIGHPDAAAESGRGLFIVEATATDWGVTARADGKAVWFDLN